MLCVYFAGVEYVERSAYDALSARLAAVEKERDEAVDLLGKILDACSGPEPTFGMYPQELWLELEGWLIAYDARLAKPEKETT